MAGSSPAMTMERLKTAAKVSSKDRSTVPSLSAVMAGLDPAIQKNAQRMRTP